MPLTMEQKIGITIRPIEISDEPLMVKFHRMLSDRTVYLRYFCSLSLSTRTDHQRLSRICFADGEREIVLVALCTEARSGEQMIVAVGRINLADNKEEGELALLVADDYQGHGVATELLTKLLEVARARGIKRLTAEMLRDNISMQTIFKRFGFRLRMLNDFRSVAAALQL